MSTLYYKVTGGLAQEAVDKFMEERASQGNKLIALCDRLGAAPGEFYGNERQISALKFDTCPEGWKSECDGWFSPKGNTKEARKLREEMQECRIPGVDRLSQLLGTGMQVRASRILRVSLEIFDGNTVLHVPEGMDFTPPDEHCVPMKASEYWQAKEAVPAA